MHQTRPGAAPRRARRRLRPHLEYRNGGYSCSCNIAPLCRKHHRPKTHTAWDYVALERGTYLWTSPNGLQYLRDHTGTLDVSADKHHRRHPGHLHPPDD